MMRLSPWRRRRQQWLRRRGARQDAAWERRQGLWRQWLLLLGRRPALVPEQLAIADLTPVQPPPGHFWADPFLWTDGNRHHCFFEAWEPRQQRGCIQAVALDGQARPVGAPVTVLDPNHHVSYPFLFSHRGQLYMLPESADQKRLDLYACTGYPERWEWVQTLLSGPRLADCTLIEHQARWWLFCAMGRGRLRLNETLVAFHADDPLSRRWQPHARNPLVRDFSGARPGGRIQNDAAGRLLRPAQNCVRRYGHGLRLQRIVELTPRHFREEPVWSITGPEVGGWAALHHLDWHRGMLAMDAQRWVSRVLGDASGGDLGHDRPSQDRRVDPARSPEP
jgi:hypothetical protein